jgi:hypothetical protein
MAANLVAFGAEFLQIFVQLNENGAFVSKLLIGIGSTIAATGILAWRKYCNSADSYHKSRYQRPIDHVPHYGSCFCERVSFKVMASKHLKAVDIPSKIRFPRVSIPYSDFELLSDERILSICSKSKASSVSGIYVFCSFCGVHILHSHSDNPAYIQVNAECLNHSSVSGIEVSYHSTGEEGSLQEHALRNFDIQDRRGSGFLSLKDRFDADINEEENPYVQCMDNESDSSSSSTTLTYDFTPSQKLMHHLHLGTDKESINPSVNLGSVRSGDSYYFSVEGKSATRELSDMQLNPSFIRTTSVRSHDHAQVPPTRQYNDLNRRQMTTDWSYGVSSVYNNSANNDGLLREGNLYEFYNSKTCFPPDLIITCE